MKVLPFTRKSIDEQELISRAKNADLEAFGQLYDLYFDRVFGYAYYKMGDRYEAEDIVEQVFLKALDNISKFEWQGTSLLPWLLKIASNQIADHFRAKKHNVIDITEILDLASDEVSGPEHTALRMSQRTEVVKAIKSLTNDQQQVITMRFLADMTSDEVAKAMNKKPGAVRALQHRAMEALSKMLGGDHDEARCG